MSWQITILIHSILSGLRSTQNRRIGLSKRDFSVYALVASFTCVFVVGIIVSLFDGKPVDHSSAWEARYYALFGGFLFGVQNFLSLHLFRIVPASIAVLMALMNPVAVVLIASVVAGEALTSRQIIGAVILLGSVLLAKFVSTGKSTKRHTQNILIGLCVSVAIAVLYGAGVVNEKYLLDRLSIGTYVLYGWGAQFFSAAVLGVLLRRKNQSRVDFTMHLNVWIYGLLLAISGLFFVITLVDSNSASLTSVSSSSKMVAAMTFAYIFLKERGSTIPKVIAVVLSGTGLYLLFS